MNYGELKIKQLKEMLEQNKPNKTTQILSKYIELPLGLMSKSLIKYETSSVSRWSEVIKLLTAWAVIGNMRRLFLQYTGMSCRYLVNGL